MILSESEIVETWVKSTAKRYLKDEFILKRYDRYSMKTKGTIRKTHLRPLFDTQEAKLMKTGVRVAPVVQHKKTNRTPRRW